MTLRWLTPSPILWAMLVPWSLTPAVCWKGHRTRAATVVWRYGDEGDLVRCLDRFDLLQTQRN